MFKFATAASLAASVLAETSDSYDYKTNGADWVTIHSGKWYLCDTGKQQSPIDLKASAATNDYVELIGYNYFNFDGANSDPLSTNLGKKMNFPTPQNEDAMLKLVLAGGKSETFTPA